MDIYSVADLFIPCPQQQQFNYNSDPVVSKTASSAVNACLHTL